MVKCISLILFHAACINKNGCNIVRHVTSVMLYLVSADLAHYNLFIVNDVYS